jgi:uncharacterized protein (DUF2141 family)
LTLVAIGLMTLFGAAGSGLSAGAAREAAAPTPSAGTAERNALDAYGKLPLAFVPNAGQTDARVRFSAQAGGASFYFTEKAAVLAFAKGKKSVALRLAFLGANPAPKIEGRQREPARVNYLLGSNPAKWHTNLPTYGEVVYRDLWPGIDMVFRGVAGTLKYEFVLRPGAKVDDIRLAYRGARRLSVNPGGELLIRTPLGVLRDERPRSYQEIGSRRLPVSSSFVLEDGGAYGFAVGRYDSRRPLVIDPGLVYSTYLGDSAFEQGLGIAVDAGGSAYVTGRADSANFPTTVGAFDTTLNGAGDAFVTKLNQTGSALLYSTFLGGSSFDEAHGIAVDVAGNAYIAGRTDSVNFPTTPGAFDTSFNGFTDAFVTKLNAAGSALFYSTYVGASDYDEPFGIALDAGGSAHVTGVTTSPAFPTTPAAFDPSFNGGPLDAFVTKLSPTGSALLYSTYLGGNDLDRGHGIAVDAGGSAYVTGQTTSVNFPTTLGAFDTTLGGCCDAFVTKLNAAGSALFYSTYLGSSGFDGGNGIAVDAGGNAYVTGGTQGAADFPTTVGAFDTTLGGCCDGFVTKLNAAGSAPLYSTYLGGNGFDFGVGIAVDAGGNAYVAGRNDSTDFPTTPGTFDPTRGGCCDGFVTKLNAAGSAPLLYSTYLGGSSFDQGSGIAVDAGGSAYVTGFTQSTDFPATVGAFDTTLAGCCDAFVTKLSTTAVPATLTLDPPADTNPVGTPHTVTATVRDADDNPVSGVTVRFTVTGANSASGSDTTDANGVATFTYTGTTVGLDTISAFADTDGDGTQDPGEPSGIATKTWTPGAPATLTLDPPADTNPVGTPHTATATVRDAGGNPAPGVTVRFSASGANSASGSDTTDANGEATFTYTGTTAGLDTISAFADSDNDGTQDPGEPSGIATKTWTPGAPATLTLDPPADVNTVGETHCVTATVRDAFGNPVPGVTVRFSVPTAVATAASPSSGSDVTDANGEATFCYSAALPGEDVIHAFADTDEDGMQDADEPFGAATKTWTLPPSTELCEVKVTQGGWIVAANGDHANFGGNARVREDGSVDGHENYQDHGPAQPRHVQSIEVTAVTCSDDLTMATIFGRATVDGAGDFVFRIDVTDLGEPGSNDTYGITMSDGYASGQQRLEGGNVQIHKS